MKTLVVYDDAGYILSIKSGEPSPREPEGVPFLWVDIPERKQLSITHGIGVDTSVNPHRVILEDIPPSEVEVLREQVKATQEAVDFLLLNGGI